MTDIAWTTLWPALLRPGGIWVAAGTHGLLSVGFLARREGPRRIAGEIQRRVGEVGTRRGADPRASAWLEQAIDELEAYFAGSKEPFRVPCDTRRFRGSFSESVWQRLRRVPFGTVVAYGDVAAEVGRVGAARAVGGAVGRNPFPIVVPCHRVVGGDGTLTGFSSGLRRKSRLLGHEGIPLRGSGDLRERKVPCIRGGRP